MQRSTVTSFSCCRVGQMVIVSACAMIQLSFAFRPAALPRLLLFRAATSTTSPTFSSSSKSSRLFSTSTSNNSPVSSTNGQEQELALLDWKGFAQTAEAAAREAGRVIVQAQAVSTSPSSSKEEEEQSSSSSSPQVKTGIKDIVTIYDKKAQASVEAVIRGAYPTHSFLGEENVDAGAAASEQALTNILENTETGFVWICDPIDGTANFASGLKLCGVTVALVYKGTAVVGVIYDPHADEMFTAIRGQGATLNGAPLSVAKEITDVKDAIINAGCPADPNAFATSMRGIAALNSKSRGLRMIACSALTTAWIAAGRLTAHFGYDLSSWDLVAGALLIQEAGGLVTDLDGSPYRIETRNMLCSNGLVHEPILEVLQEADATSFSRA